jgi:drug/metabolite transporter (DMT)-like permease
MWLVPALFATAVWSVQRVIGKAALRTLSATQYALLSSALAIPVYLPLLWLDPPPVRAFPGAIAVSAVSVVAFLITTEALKRGPVGRVSPALGFAPIPTVLLAIVFLGESVSPAQAAGVVAAVVALVLLGFRGGDQVPGRAWRGLAVASILLQGSAAFLAKVVITPVGPSALLISSALIQTVVTLALLHHARAPLPSFGTRLSRWNAAVLLFAAVATIGYLWALSRGPASIIVPFVAVAPALGGILGATVLGERTTASQRVGIAVGVAGTTLLAVGGAG